MGSQTPSTHRLSTLRAIYEVRLMEKADIPQVCQLEKWSFALPWSAFAFESELDDNQLAFYCVVCPQADVARVVGYGGLWVVIDEAHVTNIAIDPAYRGQALGELLMRQMMALAVVQGAEKMTLEVRVSNTSALRLYERLDFHEEGLRKHYYTDNNEDALIMWCDLTKADGEAEA